MKDARNLIIALPNDNLRKRSKKVGLVSSDIKEIIKLMKLSTLDWEDNRKHEVGVALAAIQIDKPYKIVVIRENFNDKSNRKFSVFINPQITKYDGKIVEDYEGCLSIRDVYGRVPRYERVKIKALDENGQPFRMTAKGFMARVLQHEIDHINGKLFIDLIKDNPGAFYMLDNEGQLKELDYEKDIKKPGIFW
jgi:peptide deformylase